MCVNTYATLNVRIKVYAFACVGMYIRRSHNKHTALNFSKAFTLILLTWRIWRVPNNASKWKVGFNSAFKGSMCTLP